MSTETAAQRGRKPGFQMSNEHRAKIQNSNILNALIEHVEGKRDMTSTQVTAGLGLLKKALPDLTSVTIGGDPEGEPIRTEDVGDTARKIAFLLASASKAADSEG